MFESLSARLSVALLGIVVAMGAAFFAVDRHNSRLYHEELTQRLNAPIAMYVTDQRQLIAEGKPDIDSLHELAAHAMVINPTAEVYLLDTDGRILGHGLPEETVLRNRIDLEPVRALLEGSARMPVHGDDPRSESMRKVFSAAEIRSGAQLQGYLYVVLGGQTYEKLANDIGSSYIGNMSIVAVLVIVGIAATIGLTLFRLLTRRLKELDRDMRRVTETGFESKPSIGQAALSRDEIDRLVRSFLAMSEKIRQQLAQLKENDRLRRELVTNISHDLRTPLSALQGYIETMIIEGDRLAPEDRSRYLEIVRRHTTRLGVLVGDLFELAKLDSASVTPSLEAFCLAELVQDVAQEFELEAEKKDVTLSLAIGPETARTVGDIGLIQRVLENLVRNAVEFTPAGGEITLSIADRPAAAAVAVAVTDTGPGIAESDIPGIFDRFYRSREGEEVRSDSSGLGLAIVKRILDLHDSRITVFSRPDTGTRFEFELPRLEEAA